MSSRCRAWRRWRLALPLATATSRIGSMRASTRGPGGVVAEGSAPSIPDGIPSPGAAHSTYRRASRGSGSPQLKPATRPSDESLLKNIILPSLGKRLVAVANRFR